MPTLFHGRGHHDRGPNRLLVVLPTWVGDFIMATPSLRAIRNRFDRASITFLMVPNLLELVDGGDWMDEVLTWPAARERWRLSGFLTTARGLRRQRFDWAVLYPNSFRSALMALASGAGRRIGYGRDGRGWLLTDRLPVPRVDGRIPPHPICRYYGQLAAALGCEMPGDRLELFTTAPAEGAIEKRLASMGIADARPLVIITPGASFGASKLWLPERFAAVSDRLTDLMGAAVVVTCGPGEQPIARAIVGAARHKCHLLDDPIATLGQLKALVRRSDLLITNDTGPRHMAKAFGVPVVTIFGPTFQEWTDTDYPEERKVAVEVDCGPCQLKTCPLDHRCMTGVTVDHVYQNCAELLEKRLARVAS